MILCGSWLEWKLWAFLHIIIYLTGTVVSRNQADKKHKRQLAQYVLPTWNGILDICSLTDANSWSNSVLIQFVRKWLVYIARWLNIVVFADAYYHAKLVSPSPFPTEHAEPSLGCAAIIELWLKYHSLTLCVCVCVCVRSVWVGHIVVRQRNSHSGVSPHSWSDVHFHSGRWQWPQQPRHLPSILHL